MKFSLTHHTGVLLLLGALSCADPPPSVYPKEVTYVEDSAAAATDVLEIRVAKQPEISGDYEIDPDGQISFPYIGPVQSGGKSVAEIQNDIQGRLLDGYLRDPQVIVRIKDRRSKKVSIFGEVHKATTLPFVEGMTINEALSGAGGFTPRAWENAVKVTRKTSKGSEEFTIPVKSIANGKAAPFYMRPGDSVYVPKSPI